MNIIENRPASGRLAPLVQAGLAALVAGSLLAFSAIAFNDGFTSTVPEAGVAASPIETDTGRPVVVPGGLRALSESGPDLVAQAPEGPEQDAGEDASVLGTQIDRPAVPDPDVQQNPSVANPSSGAIDRSWGDPDPGADRETHDGSSAWGDPRDGHGGRGGGKKGDGAGTDGSGGYGSGGDGSGENDSGNDDRPKPERPEAKPRDDDDDDDVDDVDGRDDDDDDSDDSDSGTGRAEGDSGGSRDGDGGPRLAQASQNIDDPSQGPTGDTYNAASQGASGSHGASGSQAATGSQGASGSHGASGSQGGGTEGH